MRKIIIFIIIETLLFAMTACNNNTINIPAEEQQFQNEHHEQQNEEHKEKQVYEIINENIIIGEGTEWELPGLLTVPKNAEGKIPAVVLVHGSGPQDMDETIFINNKPFRDIANYLSSQGIAVIRYDKRTFKHSLKFVREIGKNATVYEETIEDAILATEILKSDPRIDKNKVFILGHSLGGMLAPRIHAMGGDFAGLILFAGTPRSLLEVMHDQQILYYTETMESEELEKILTLINDGTTKTQLEEQTALIINMSDEEAKAVDGGSGVSCYYYKDLLLNPAEIFIKDITVPFLVMQGNNDWQVFTDKDFAMYKKLLGDRSNVTFKLYEGLNHFFMPSTVTKSIDINDEYKIANHIDSQVLTDIADWINAN